MTPPAAQKGPATELGASGRRMMTIRKARRSWSVPVPKEWAFEFDSLMLVALSTQRDGHMVLFCQTRRD